MQCEPVCSLGLKECSLDCLGRGQKGRVSVVAGPNRCRLLELGFTRGTEVEVSRRAAFGGPMEVRLRSYRLSLRMDEAASIHVETDDDRTAPCGRPWEEMAANCVTALNKMVVRPSETASDPTSAEPSPGAES
ncbi:MAG: ferrous iron transport protein A [Capsulimonadales bacterium]|nr:ferrous iron transport protein A [Capsulimonadales bacterium]